MTRTFKDRITNEELSTLPRALYTGRIRIIDSEEKIDEACNYLLSFDVIGFDTETKPSFKVGVTNKVALLQLSTHECSFLFRLCRMRFDKAIIKILESEAIKKVGVDVKGDLHNLQKLRHFRPGGFVELQTMASECGIEEMSLRKMSAIVTGQTVSKAQRLSNWESSTLTEAQMRYAATDAWMSLNIYDKLKEHLYI